MINLHHIFKYYCLLLKTFILVKKRIFEVKPIIKNSIVTDITYQKFLNFIIRIKQEVNYFLICYYSYKNRFE